MCIFNKFFIIALLIIPIMGSCTADSADSDFPEGCTGDNFEYKDNNLLLDLNASGQSLFLLHNISEYNYWLDHPITKDPGASAGWATTLNASQWSALSINNNSNDDSFALSCAIIGKNGKISYLDCKDVLVACKAESAKFKSGNSGSYWVAENQNLNSVLKTVKSRGIIWPD